MVEDTVAVADEGGNLLGELQPNKIIDVTIERTILFVKDSPYRSFHKQANGLRYPRVGGTRERHFNGISFKPHKLLENAATPTRRVHAVLGVLLVLDQFSSLCI
jgi:hypothetical protein